MKNADIVFADPERNGGCFGRRRGDILVCWGIDGGTPFGGSTCGGYAGRD